MDCRRRKLATWLRSKRSCRNLTSYTVCICSLCSNWIRGVSLARTIIPRKHFFTVANERGTNVKPSRCFFTVLCIPINIKSNQMKSSVHETNMSETTAVERLRLAKQMLNMLHRRNKNQHRRSHWFRWLAMLGRSTAKFLLAFQREDVTGMAAYVVHMKSQILPKCYA